MRDKDVLLEEKSEILLFIKKVLRSSEKNEVQKRMNMKNR